MPVFPDLRFVPLAALHTATSPVGSRACLRYFLPQSTPNSDIDLPPWLPPKQTNANDLEWAPLHTLDLSRIAGEDFTEVPEDVVKDVGQAFSQVGFIYCEGHGLSYGELLRQ